MASISVFLSLLFFSAFVVLKESGLGKRQRKKRKRDRERERERESLRAHSPRFLVSRLGHLLIAVVRFKGSGFDFFSRA